MFDAFVVKEIVKDLNVVIESIATHGSTLLVGTMRGSLLIYNLEKDKSSPDIIKSFSKSRKAVTQLGIVKKAESLIISLTDLGVSIHSYDTSCRPHGVEFKALLEKTRGAKVFALHEFTDDRNRVQLAVAVRNNLFSYKIRFYQWSEKGIFSKVKNVILSLKVPEALLYTYSDCLLVGFKKKYSQLKISTGNMVDIPHTGKQKKYALIRMDKDSVILNVGKDGLTVLLDDEGTPKDQQLQWSETPSAFLYSNPYILGVLSQGIEVKNIHKVDTIQKIDLPGIKFVAQDESLFVASPTRADPLRVNSIWQLTTDYSDQVEVDNFQEWEESRIASEVQDKCVHTYGSIAKTVEHKPLLLTVGNYVAGTAGAGAVVAPVASVKLDAVDKQTARTRKEEFSGIPDSVLVNPSTLEVLGSGSYGTVYKFDRNAPSEDHQQLAIKVLMIPTHLSKAVHTEVQLHKTLTHKNIITYIGTYQATGHACIIMERSEIGSLEKRLHKLHEDGKQLSDEQMLSYVGHVLCGLDYLHSQKPPIIHRDVRSANILIFLNDVAKLADFGISKQLKNLATGSGFHTVVGNEFWQAPEMIDSDNQSENGRKVDMWSWAITMLEMGYTSKVPIFELSLSKYVLRLIGKKELPEIPNDLNDQLQEVVKACLVYNPDDRATAKEALQLLHHGSPAQTQNKDLKKPMSLSKILGGCSLNINCAEVWTHPSCDYSYILLGTEQGLYSLDTASTGDPTMMILSSKRVMWLNVFENTLLTMSGDQVEERSPDEEEEEEGDQPYIYSHNLLLLHQDMKEDDDGQTSNGHEGLQATTILDGSKGVKKACAVENAHTEEYICCVLTSASLLFYVWRGEKFERVKVLSTPSEHPEWNPKIFETVIRADEALPRLCVGVYSESYNLHLELINPNKSEQGSFKLEPGTSAPLPVHTLCQIDRDTILVGYGSQANLVDQEGRKKQSAKVKSHLNFSGQIENFLCPDLECGLLGFHKNGMEGRSLSSGQVEAEVRDENQTLRLVSSGTSMIILEGRDINDTVNNSFNLYELK